MDRSGLWKSGRLGGVADSVVVYVKWYNMNDLVKSIYDRAPGSKQMVA